MQTLVHSFLHAISHCHKYQKKYQDLQRHSQNQKQDQLTFSASLTTWRNHHRISDQTDHRHYTQFRSQSLLLLKAILIKKMIFSCCERRSFFKCLVLHAPYQTRPQITNLRGSIARQANVFVGIDNL
jgi:hypothetical protein